MSARSSVQWPGRQLDRKSQQLISARQKQALINKGASAIYAHDREGTRMSGKKKFVTGLLASTALVWTTTTVALAQSTDGSEEVVVTAQKRQERIQDVPMSVQSVSGEKLNQLGVESAADLAKVAPGFSYAESRYGTPIYTIRGVGFQDSALASSPTVSLYLDEVPIPYSALGAGISLDLQRVEVLKGPQGTLFGSNATGGAVNYIAEKPTDYWSYGADLSYGRFSKADLKGYVSGPLSDTLQVRLAAQVRSSGPWQKSYTRPDELGREEFYNGRLSFNWDPSDDVRVSLTLTGFKDRGETQAAQFIAARVRNLVNGVIPELLNYPVAPHDNRAADWGACVNKSGLNEPYNVPNPDLLAQPTNCSDFRKDIEYYSAALRVEYDITDNITLTSISAYQSYDRTMPGDIDGTSIQNYEYYQTGEIDNFFQELRLSGTFDRGNWIVGANYTNDDTYDEFLQSYAATSGNPVFGMLLGPTRPVNTQKTDTYAVYGNVEYEVYDHVTLQGGVRYTKSNNDYDGCMYDSGDGTWAKVSQLIQNFLETTWTGPGKVSGQGVDVGPGGCAVTNVGPTFNPRSLAQELDEDNVSWRVGVKYEPTEDVMLYANVSKGWKAGSFPTISATSYPQFRPVVQESLLAYEAGFKATFLEGKLVLNGAGFYYDYENKQILGSLRDPVFGALSALVNVPHSSVRGFELSAIWKPVEGLTIAPAVSYQDSSVDGCSADEDAFCIDGEFWNYDPYSTFSSFDGKSFPNAPEWQVNVDAEYEWTVGTDYTASLGGHFTYASSTTSAFTNETETARYPAEELDVKSYKTLDLYAGIGKDNWEFQVWGRNVTDEWYWTNAVSNNDATVRYTARPATYGIRFVYYN